MSEHNIALIRRHFLLEEQGDVDAVLQDMADPPEYFMPAVGDEKIRDKQWIYEHHIALHEAFPDLHIEVESIFATDTHGAAQVLITGTQKLDYGGMRATGKTCRWHVCAIFTFRDGKIVSESAYYDWGELARSLGAKVTLE